MDQKITECLAGAHGSYILPFLWLHGEPKERIYEEILAIKNSGIREFCAESRPYKEFCREAWWEDFGFILETARSLGMRVWLLDDRHFPTGYANGYLEKEENAHLRKKLIREFQAEAMGPMKHAKIFVGGRVYEGERVIRVIAYRHTDADEGLDYDSAIDLTDTLRDGMVYFDVPAGVWRVCVTVETAPFEYRNSNLFYYIDMLNPDSCRAMIDAVYQPHFDHFKDYFGNTFAGFFSDEPGFLNVAHTYYNKLGVMESPFPWREDLPAMIAESAGMETSKVEAAIPALWEDLGEITTRIRTHYMEVVTRLYRDNFSYLLGDWCREHGVMYIGHVIEDMGAHMRLGYGSGHFFRALDGQDMGGIDIVLHQDIPGLSDHAHRAPLADGGKADPTFFRYTLPKLGASHAHIQPLKMNRAMCEIFGAFGWAEGLPFMKGLADIMLASGINRFVPHAFTPKTEDPDCPPHFYNGGKNIQFPLFKNLMDYMGRTVHVLEGGRHKADVAVFYNAEGEWTGGKNQLFFTLCRVLTQGLIDFDIVPIDALTGACVEDGKLLINGEEYGALLVSESEILPYDRVSVFAKLAEAGLPVLFTDALPTRTAEGKTIDSLLDKFTTVPTHKLVDELRARGLCHVSGTGEGLAHLRFYHVTRENASIYLFSNEDVYGKVDARLAIPENGPCLVYEPWSNTIYQSEAKNGTLPLVLEGGNMLFFLFGVDIPVGTPVLTRETARKPLSLRYEIAVREEDEEEFRLLEADSEAFDLSAPDRMPEFSGQIRYRTTFEAEDGFSVLDLGQVGEVAEVWLNGKHLGARINAPYKLSMTDALAKGENHLEVIVTSNLAHRRRDLFSTFIQIPPTGLVGDVALVKYEA